VALTVKPNSPLSLLHLQLNPPALEAYGAVEGSARDRSFRGLPLSLWGPGGPPPPPGGLGQAQQAALQPQPVSPAHPAVSKRGFNSLRQQNMKVQSSNAVGMTKGQHVTPEEPGTALAESSSSACQQAALQPSLSPCTPSSQQARLQQPAADGG
jgi:hypothetical protein